MNEFQLFMSDIFGAVKSIGLADVVDILLISYVIYKTIKIVKETRAEQLLKGIFLLLLAYFLSAFFHLRTLKYMLKMLFEIGAVSLVVLFQPELRRALEKVGRTKVADFSVFGKEESEKRHNVWEKAITAISNGAAELSKTKTGALIVIERKTKLGEQIDTGVEINATPSVELLGNIFFNKSPLHDGALIVRDGRLLAAACFLPKPQKEELIATHLGSRHRAAIGISEISDAITIVVSEETGTISVSQDGQLIRNFTRESLYTYLMDKVAPVKDTDGTEKKKSVFRRAKKK